jgi:hypothetical protein
VTYQPSVDLDREVQDILIEELQPIKSIVGLSPSLVIQPLYEAAVRANHARGGSAAGIQAKGPLTGTSQKCSHAIWMSARFTKVCGVLSLAMPVILFNTRWNDAKDDDSINALANMWLQRSLGATNHRVLQ